MTISHPNDLVYVNCQPELRNFQKGGTPTLTGRRQTSYSDAGFWEVMAEFHCNSYDSICDYYATLDRLREGEDMLLKICSIAKARGARESEASATLASAADLRATTVTIDVVGMALRTGNFFTIGDRLHRINRVLSAPEIPPLLGPWQVDSPWDDPSPFLGGEDVTGTYEVRFLPPLRGDTDAGTTVNFKNLRLRCELKSPRDGDLKLENGRRGKSSLTLIESFS